MDYRIREARVEDAEAAVHAHEAAWDAALAELAGKRLGELAPFEGRVETFRSGLAQVSPDARVWVAEADGEVVGLAVVRREDAQTVELKDLYVAPDAWGSGVAPALMETALASIAGAAADTLWVVEANARARRFYEREGWAADGGSRSTPLGPSEVRYRRRRPRL
jgi:GNAT superfamily N-acetyltransferase